MTMSSTCTTHPLSHAKLDRDIDDFDDFPREPDPTPTPEQLALWVPCPHPAGSPEKVAVMQARYAAGLPVFHPGDNPGRVWTNPESLATPRFCLARQLQRRGATVRRPSPRARGWIVRRKLSWGRERFIALLTHPGQPKRRTYLATFDDRESAEAAARLAHEERQQQEAREAG